MNIQWLIDLLPFSIVVVVVVLRWDVSFLNPAELFWWSFSAQPFFLPIRRYKSTVATKSKTATRLGWILKLKWAKFPLLFRWLSCSENGKIFSLQSVQKEGKKKRQEIFAFIQIHRSDNLWSIDSNQLQWRGWPFFYQEGNFSGCNDLILPKASCLPFSA